jgi:hypothetical protein
MIPFAMLAPRNGLDGSTLVHITYSSGSLRVALLLKKIH